MNSLRIIILITLTVLAAAIFLMPIKLYIVIRDNSKNMYLSFGFIKKKLSKPECKDSDNEQGKTAPREASPPDKLTHYFKSVKALRHNLTDLLGYICARGASVDLLNLKLSFGWNDEAEVGISYGLTNAFIYTVMGALHNALTIKKWNISITPHYDKEIFDLDFECVLKTRTVHITVVLIKLFKIYLKYKKSKKEYV